MVDDEFIRARSIKPRRREVEGGDVKGKRAQRKSGNHAWHLQSHVMLQRLNTIKKPP